MSVRNNQSRRSASRPTRKLRKTVWRFASTAFESKQELLIGHGNLEEQIRKIIRTQEGRPFIITSSRIQRSLPPIRHILGLAKGSLSLPDGERAKEMSSVERVWTKLSQACLNRDDLIIAIGGGTLLDVAGFAASTFHRGLELILVPTTLLAACDAAIGGKNAVNLGGIKNVAGTFYFPRFVVIDTSLFGSLGKENILEAVSEAAKHSLLKDHLFLNKLASWREAAQSLDPLTLCNIISFSIKAKMEFVRRDPFDLTGERAKLNLGHTFAHSFEAVGKDLRTTHGLAVALGLLAASSLSLRRGLLDKEVLSTLRLIFNQYGLRVKRYAKLADRIDDLYAAILKDKKSRSNIPTFLLPVMPRGAVAVRDVKKAELRKAILDLFTDG